LQEAADLRVVDPTVHVDQAEYVEHVVAIAINSARRYIISQRWSGPRPIALQRLHPRRESRCHFALDQSRQRPWQFAE